MKKTLTLILALVMVLSLAACGKGNNGTNNNAATETINFDLSKYESHGTLSCGRIWCSVIEGSWDTPNTEKFAYFDSNGNQISQWFEKSKYSPTDYTNNLAIIYVAGDSRDPYRHIIALNIDGQQIASLRIRFYGGAGRNYVGISEVNSDGIACCYAYHEYNYQTPPLYLYWIDASGSHKFNIDAESIVRSYTPESMDVRKVGENFVLYLGGTYNYYTAIFSKNGNLILNVTEAIGGYEIRNISMDGASYNVRFEGMDGKYYTAIIEKQENLFKVSFSGMNEEVPAYTVNRYGVKSTDNSDYNADLSAELLNGTWISETAGVRKDTFRIYVAHATASNWKIEYSDGTSESLWFFADIDKCVFSFDASTELPFVYNQNGKITLTLQDGSQITLSKVDAE